MEDITQALPEFNEIRKYWDLLPNRDETVLTDDDIRQATSSIHCVGPYIWFISDLRHPKPILVGGQIEKMTGYTEQEVLASNFTIALKLITVKDFLYLALSGRRFWKYFYGKPVHERLFIKASYSYSFHRKDNSTFHALHQAATLKMDANGKAVFQFDLIQDISHFNPVAACRHFIIDSSDPAEVKRIPSDMGLWRKTVELLSPSELKVLSLIKGGFTSQEIADRLYLSVHTIKTHRQNMLEKTGVQSSIELLNFAAVNNLL